MNATLEKGNWLIGHSPKEDGSRLVYAMQISEVLGMREYFRDARFQCKKPKPDGTLEEQCGDNFYYENDGRWKRLPSRFHNNCAAFQKDLGKKFEGHPVFVASRFYYFGAARVAIPNCLEKVIQLRHGIHYTEGHLADEFVAWLEANYSLGVLGSPQHMVDHSHEVSPMITEWLTDCAQQSTNLENKGCSPNHNTSRLCRTC